ncbi:MAG: dihydropteroate synthase [Polyangiaceae bacterium]|nr:dihydropteroate synthase [Polyangiaceae bacterium]
MAVVNVTPDSFFDGGRWATPDAARRRVDEVLAEGADIVDLGGESTRPGAPPVPPAAQWERVETALRHAVARGALVSIDTTSPEVAARALGAGARIVNDVSCLADVELARVAARAGAVLLLMHSRGTMEAMRGFSAVPEEAYTDVVGEVLSEWRAARARAVEAGMPPAHVWLDPGLGFHKSARHSLQLVARSAELARAGARLAIGPSRKSFIDAVDPAAPAERLGGTIAACVLAVAGGASVVRVHDVQPVRQALRLAWAARPARAENGGPSA